MKKLFFLLTAFGCIAVSNAQNTLDILNLTGRYGFPQEYEQTYTGKATEYGSFLNLTVPVPFSDNTIWYNSLNHFYFNVQGDDAIPAGEVNPTILNGFILRTGLYQKFSNGRGIQILFAPRLMSDLKNISSRSFQFGGVFMYEKVFNPDLALSFGAMYNSELFGPYVVPIINMNWKISDKWRIRGLFPVTLNVIYAASENLSVGLSHFGLVTSYALGNLDYAGDYIERQSIDITLFLRQRIAGNLFAELKFGRTFGRKYTQYSSDQKVPFSLPLVGFGDERVANNIAFNDGLLFNLGIAYSIVIPE